MAEATVPAAPLRQFVHQIEGIDRDIGSLNTDKVELYKAAKHAGLSPKIIKRVIAERRKDPADRDDDDALFRQYWLAVHAPLDSAPKPAHARTPARTRDPQQIDIEEAIAARREAAE